MALLYKFYKHSVEDRNATIAAGRRIYKDQDRVDIIIPGSRDDMRTHIVDADRIQCWEDSPDPEHKRALKLYEAFTSQQEVAVVGTPLEMAPFLSPSQVENLKAPPLHCQTIEQLGEMSDAQMAGVPFGLGLRDQAKKYMEAATGPAAVMAKMMEMETRFAQLQAELANKDAQISGLLNNARPAGSDMRAAPDDDIGPPAPGAVRADPSKVAVKREDPDDADLLPGTRRVRRSGVQPEE